MIAVNERQLLMGTRGRGWNGQTGVVLLVVAGSSEVEGIAGGELRGGEGYGGEVVFGQVFDKMPARSRELG